MNQQAAGATQRHVLNLVDYLSAYDARRFPPIRSVDDYGMFKRFADALPEDPAVRLHHSDQAWLAADFVDLPAAVEPPPEVAELLVDGPTVTALAEPAIRPEPDPAQHDVHVGAQPEPLDERRDGPDLSDPVVRQLATDWIDQVWRPWAAEWSAAAAVKAVHRDLFEQRERLAIDRDSVELIWGFGRLRWLTDDAERVDHPVLTISVEIDNDPGTSRLVVRPSGALQVESRFLNGLELHHRNGYSALRQAIAAEPIDPWVEGDLDDLVRRLIRCVDPDGSVVDRTVKAAASARADTSGVLFLRRRVPDSQGFLEDMRELYRVDPSVIPAALRSIMTTDEPVEVAGGGLRRRAQVTSGPRGGAAAAPPAHQ